MSFGVRIDGNLAIRDRPFAGVHCGQDVARLPRKPFALKSRREDGAPK